jgi:hypothetical protein
MPTKEQFVGRVRELAAAVEELPEGPGRSLLRAEVSGLIEVVDAAFSDKAQELRPRGVLGVDNGTSNCCNTKLR